VLIGSNSQSLSLPLAHIPQIWSVKKNEEAAAKKKPKMTAAQLRVQKGESRDGQRRGSFGGKGARRLAGR
jgi:hypothetical protein